MAGSVNKVILVGHLGRDPEVRHTQNNQKIVHLAVATSERWKDRQSGEARERTEWHRVVIFDEHLAEIAERHLRKGSPVYLEGTLQTRKWTDQGGQPVSRTSSTTISHSKDIWSGRGMVVTDWEVLSRGAGAKPCASSSARVVGRATGRRSARARARPRGSGGGRGRVARSWVLGRQQGREAAPDRLAQHGPDRHLAQTGPGQVAQSQPYGMEAG